MPLASSATSNTRSPRATPSATPRQNLRAVSRVLQREPNDRNLDGIFRAEQVWGSRQGPIRVALQRLRRADIDSLLIAAARADRVAKGSLRGEPWVEITGLVARIAGVKLAAA